MTRFSLVHMMVFVAVISAACFAMHFALTLPNYSQSLGEFCLETADREDAVADQWVEKLKHLWAGYNYGEYESINRNVALAIIKGHREIATRIRAEIPGQKGYIGGDWETLQAKQRAWQDWRKTVKDDK